MASGAVIGWTSHHFPRAQTSTRPHRRVLGDFGCEVGPDAAITQDPNAAAETATIVLRGGTEMHTANASQKRIVPEAIATLGLLPWGQYGCWRRHTDNAPCGLRRGAKFASVQPAVTQNWTPPSSFRTSGISNRPTAQGLARVLPMTYASTGDYCYCYKEYPDLLNTQQEPSDGPPRAGEGR